MHTPQNFGLDVVKVTHVGNKYIPDMSKLQMVDFASTMLPQAPLGSSMGMAFMELFVLDLARKGHQPGHVLRVQQIAHCSQHRPTAQIHQEALLRVVKTGEKKPWERLVTRRKSVLRPSHRAAEGGFW